MLLLPALSCAAGSSLGPEASVVVLRAAAGSSGLSGVQQDSERHVETPLVVDSMKEYIDGIVGRKKQIFLCVMKVFKMHISRTLRHADFTAGSTDKYCGIHIPGEDPPEMSPLVRYKYSGLFFICLLRQYAYFEINLLNN